ncbi:hypothetical protein JCM11641_006099 [Rhodosporidiobolus odoratus]
MSAKHLLRPLRKLLLTAHTSPCQARPSSGNFSPRPRHLSNALPRYEQATWDTLVDDAGSFKSTSAASDSSALPSRRPSRPPSSPYRTPSRTSPPPRQRTAGRPQHRGSTPTLPALHPLPSLDSLDPVHLHALRLHVSNTIRRVPTPEDLQHSLRPWLIAQHKHRVDAFKSAEQRAKKQEDQRHQLDLAWEWQRQVDVSAGLPRTEQQKNTDAKVLRRLDVKRREKMEAEQEREAQEWQRAVGERKKPSASSEGLSAGAGATSAGAGATSSAQELDEHAPDWKRHRQTMLKKFPGGWEPPKRISREAMDLIRTLARDDPQKYTVSALAQKFKISPEAVRRIVKSRFELPPEEKTRREAKRKDMRQRDIAQGGVQGNQQAWGGDVAGERQEMRNLRSRVEGDR